MEDTAISKDEKITDILKESKTSIDRLHEAKPHQDISIKNETSEAKPPTLTEKVEESKGPSQTENAPTENDKSKIETVYKKLDVSGEKAESTRDSTDSGKEKDDIKADTKIVPPLNEIKGPLSEHHSDIFSAAPMECRRSASNLYSVKGSPSGRINRQRDSNTNVFPVGCMGCKEELDVRPSPRRFLDANEASKDIAGHLDNTPRKRPSSGVPLPERNPLTGAGMEPTDSRRQMIKRKDGNPVLGTGYDEPNNTSSANRIPPGGYSKGLW